LGSSAAFQVQEDDVPLFFPDYLKRLALASNLSTTTSGAEAEVASALDDDRHTLLTSSHASARFARADPSFVSSVLGYSFTNPTLLTAALTHCSVASSASNQRLEWLGDAVMDFVVIRLLFERFPLAQEGELSQRKSDATCNKALASVASVLRIHHWLEHRSPKLAADFASVDAGLAQAAEGAATVSLDCLPSSCVKILADTLEALVGAVYLDAGCNEEGLAAVKAVILQVGVLSP
jgi:dsRNA-specific ribonuclease